MGATSPFPSQSLKMTRQVPKYEIAINTIPSLFDLWFSWTLWRGHTVVHNRGDGDQNTCKYWGKESQKNNLNVGSCDVTDALVLLASLQLAVFLSKYLCYLYDLYHLYYRNISPTKFVRYHWLLFILIDYHWFSLIIIDYCKRLLFTGQEQACTRMIWLVVCLFVHYHWSSSITIDYHWLLLIIIGYH